jgi:GNAT superfamily N-acetyltransferase
VRYGIRRATKRDVEALVRHRVEMFRSMRPVGERELSVIAGATRRHLLRALPRGEYLAWVAEAEGAIVAGVGVIPRFLMPRPGAPRGGTEAYVLNVFTEEGHRRRGLSTRLMKAAVAWARRERFSLVTLHASMMGRPVYEALGFTDRTEMRLMLGAFRRRRRGWRPA